MYQKYVHEIKYIRYQIIKDLSESDAIITKMPG